MRKTFASFAGDGLQLNVKRAPFDRAGVKEAKRLGYVVLARATDDPREVELPVFLVRMARMGMGPQRKAQFACAKQIMKGWGSPRGERDVPGALFFFHAEGRTRLSLVTPRDQAATDYKRQSFLLVPEEKGRVRNQTFCKYFDGSRVTCFGRPGEKVRGARSLLARFSVEALTKEFYTELFAWYEWAAEKAGVRFPNAVGDLSKTKEHLIRLITRLMFVWFVRERGLVPDELFDAKWLGERFLRDFDPKDDKDGTYYNAVLQNLFFATLNQPVQERRFADERSYHGKNASYGVNTLFRDKYMRVEAGTWFRLSHDEVLKLFASVPYLNGGLFECLDPEDKKTAENCRDGFSRCAKNRAVLPNRIFFGDGKREGLLTLLKRYDFTIDENHATDADIALDPELLGKVFENLLASYNPETGVSARKASGSFYTPREIVDYMVDQSLRAALASVADAKILDVLFGEDAEAIAKLPAATKAKIRERLRALKTIDPACGSGAFPMGLLNRMLGLLADLGEENTYQSKLHIIEQGIYGVDIQPIAIQISKLRFFISLLCDQTPDPSKPNAGLDQLPNLETHLVVANSLIGFNEGEEYLTPKPVQQLRELLKGIRAKHVQVHTRAAKLRLRAEDREIRTQIQEHFRNMGLSGVDYLAKWDPYDPTAFSPFFDAQWMFSIDKFDIVIGNPPYVQKKKGEVSARQFPWSEGKDKGKQNLYKVFVEHGYNLAKEHGVVCFIVQSSLMCDLSATATRELLLRHTHLLQIIEFPKDTDDPEVKVFKSVLTGTCIALFRKENASDAHFKLSIHNTLRTIHDLQFSILSQEELLKGGHNLEFPLLRPGEAKLFLKMRTQFRTFNSMILGTRQGNINTIYLKSIQSPIPTSILLGKGIYIHRYHYEQSTMYGKETREMLKLAKQNEEGFVVLTQGITGTTDKNRIHACRAECRKTKIVFLDSANITYLPSPESARLAVGLLNSSLLDWVFRTTSTNNNVNFYELEALPIPSEDVLNSADGQALEALVERAEAGEDVQSQIDEVVYRLYGLTAEEIALVERSFERSEKRSDAAEQRVSAGADEDDEDDEEA